jgi:invasion protein IalB
MPFPLSMPLIEASTIEASMPSVFQIVTLTRSLAAATKTTQIDIGILVAKGADLKLGNGKSYKLNFVDCNPRRCESTLAMDDAVIN